MISFLRAHRVQALALFAAGATLGLTTGYIANAAPTGYTACANASDQLALLNSKGTCPSGDSKVTVGAQGPAGPSGVVSMTQYSASNEGTFPTTAWGFIGSPPLEVFTNSDTGAEVIATVNEASEDPNTISVSLGVCYEPGGSSEVFNVSYIGATFDAAPTPLFNQTVSGGVGNQPAGRYYVGVCEKAQRSVTVIYGASVSVMLAQTASGVTSGAR